MLFLLLFISFILSCPPTPINAAVFAFSVCLQECVCVCVCMLFHLFVIYVTEMKEAKERLAVIESISREREGGS